MSFSSRLLGQLDQNLYLGCNNVGNQKSNLITLEPLSVYGALLGHLMLLIAVMKVTQQP